MGQGSGSGDQALPLRQGDESWPGSPGAYVPTRGTRDYVAGTSSPGVRTEMTSHFRISSSGHLCPLLNRKVFEIVLLFLRPCSIVAIKPDPNLSAKIPRHQNDTSNPLPANSFLCEPQIESRPPMGGMGGATVCDPLFRPRFSQGDFVGGGRDGAQENRGGTGIAL